MVDLLAGLTPTTSTFTVGTSCSSWAPTVADPSEVTDGDDGTSSTVGSTVKNGPCTYYIAWTFDLGSADWVLGGRMYVDNAGSWAVEYADDPGGPWTEVYSFDPNSSGYEELMTWDPVEARYWRALHSDTRTGLSFKQAVNLYTFELTQGETPDPDPPPDETLPPWTPPEPAQAIVEIYVTDPDGPRWDVDEWDEAVWGIALWVDISYASTLARAVHGSDNGDRGILADQRAAQFQLQTWDPDRHLDPANDAGPFAGQIVSGTPIRLNHRSTTLWTGKITVAQHSIADRRGVVHASDGIFDMAQAVIPPDSDLADTLYQRARDAIAAAGIPVRVAPTPRGSADGPLGSGDPALVPYTPGDARTVWEAVQEAARQVLCVPYMDRDNVLRFRPWVDGLERGRELAAPELVDVLTWIGPDGLYSGVRVLDDDGITVIERTATPTPAWGSRVYDDRENRPTPNAAAWADQVLADRRTQTLRYRPGEVRPLDADSVERLGTIEILEGVDLISPLDDIAEHVRILGASIVVTDETRQGEAVRSRWRFQFTVSASPPIPLANDDDLDDYLTTEDESDYLYEG